MAMYVGGVVLQILCKHAHITYKHTQTHTHRHTHIYSTLFKLLKLVAWYLWIQLLMHKECLRILPSLWFYLPYIKINLKISLLSLSPYTHIFIRVYVCVCIHVCMYVFMKVVL